MNDRKYPMTHEEIIVQIEEQLLNVDLSKGHSYVWVMSRQTRYSLLALFRQSQGSVLPPHHYFKLGFGTLYGFPILDRSFEKEVGIKLLPNVCKYCLSKFSEVHNFCPQCGSVLWRNYV